MQNFYRDNDDILFHLRNMDLARVVELKENGFEDKDRFDIAPSSVDEAREMYDNVLEIVGDLAANLIAPKASEVDQEGAHFKDGEVTYARGTAEALKVCKESQLFGFTLPRKYGGLNCPITIYNMAIEIISRADASFMNIYGLQDDIAGTLNKFASEEIKQRVLPRLCSGDVTSSMALTEPNAGSDLQSVMTRARENGNGQWLLTGVKHFITNGNGQLSLVLARSEPDTHDGRGLSMFLYEREGHMTIRRIEHKLGIHGSPTCELEFNEAPAILIGQRRMGLIKYVMSLMNEARVGVSAQAVGIAEAAYRAAFKYAGERVQFKTPIRKIIPVAEMLLQMKVKIEAGRALLYETTRMVDIKDGLERTLELQTDTSRELRDEVKKFTAYAAMLTPMCKAYVTEMANQVASDGVQVHGGVGYTTEFMAERYFRDARITNIYEGTTQLQVVAAIGGIAKGTYAELVDDIEASFDGSSMSEELKTIQAMYGKFDSALQHVRDQKNADLQTYHSRRLVEMATEVLIGYLLLRDAIKSDRKKEVLRRYLEVTGPALTMKSEIVLNDPTGFLERRDLVLEGLN